MANHFGMPDHIVIGENALEDAKVYLNECGKKACIVTGKHVVKSDMMGKLREALEACNISYVVFDGITGEPTDVMIEQGIQVYKENACDFCIGIGGGSPLDSAKAIAAMITNEGTIADYMGRMITKKVPPIVAIPTTAGTGSEATKMTIVTDTKKDIKMLLKGDVLVPNLAIVDPTFTLSSPKSITAATGLDALTHAIESYTSKRAFCMTDTLAIASIKRIMEYLPIAYRNGNDADAREQMAIAALEAGVCINNSSVTLVHGMSRPIGALFHVPHGLSNAMLLKDCLTFALDGAYDRFAILGREIGVSDTEDTDETAAKNFLKAVEEVCKACEVPTFTSYGIEKEDFYSKMDKMAGDAIASGSPANTRKPVTKEDIIEIYKKCFA